MQRPLAAARLFFTDKMHCLQLGDVASFIVDKEIEILDGLQTLVQQCSPVLLSAYAALSQIDW